jgi:hypothetical protein
MLRAAAEQCAGESRTKTGPNDTPRSIWERIIAGC